MNKVTFCTRSLSLPQSPIYRNVESLSRRPIVFLGSCGGELGFIIPTEIFKVTDPRWEFINLVL